MRNKQLDSRIPTPRFIQHNFCTNGDNTTVATSPNSKLHTFTTKTSSHNQEKRSDVTIVQSNASSSNFLPPMFGEPLTATHGNASSVSGVGDNQLLSQILTPGLFHFL